MNYLMNWSDTPQLQMHLFIPSICLRKKKKKLNKNKKIATKSVPCGKRYNAQRVTGLV